MTNILLLSTLGPGGIAGIIAGALALIVIIWAVATANAFSRAKVKIAEADSGIDVALQKRYDLLTKAVNAAKGYIKHESQTFAKVIELRKGMSMDQKAQAVRQLDELKSNINVVAENYPQLRSSEVFVSLQSSIADSEEHLQAARRLYNANVSHYNQMRVVFPSSIIASMGGHTEKPFFVTEEGKRKDVDIAF